MGTEHKPDVDITKLFTCKRCKERVSAIWRISITAIGVSVDICDKCKDELGDKIVEFMKG